MGTGVRTAAALAMLVAAAGCTSSHSASRVSSGAVGDGEYTGHGQNIQQIAFTVRDSGHTMSELHGTFAVACASSGGSSYQTQTFADPDHVAIDGSGNFADHYEINATGGIKAMLTVDGHVSGTTATGHLQFAEPYCGTPLDGWAAAAPGQALPPVPTFSAPDSAACTPQPCSILGKVVLQIEAVHVVTKADDPNTHGVDVEFGVLNSSSAPVSVSDANFRLTPQGGTALYSSYAGFVDSAGQQVGCLHGNAPLLPAGGSETQQHACFLPPADLLGRPLTLTWQLTGSGSATVQIGSAQ